jgi:hypothetical protein
MRVKSGQMVMGAVALVIALVFAIVLFGPKGEVATDGFVPAQQTASGAPGTPQLALDKEFVDMGVVSNTENSTTVVAVRNEGNAPLVISSVRGSCSCIWGKVDETTIPPGGSTNLTIELDPYQIPGFDTKKLILIHSNDDARKVANMDVVAKIEPEFAFEPPTLQFGTIEKGQTPEASAIIRQIREEPFEIEKVQVHGPNSKGVSVTFEPVPEQEWKQPGKREFRITAKVLPAIGTGRMVVPIDVFPTIERFKNGFRTAAMAEVTTFYKVEPERVVQMSRVKPGSASVVRVTVTAERPIEIQNAKASLATVTARAIPDPDDPNKAYLDFDIASDVKPGRIKGQIAFTVSSQGQTYEEELLLYGLVVAEDGAAAPEPAASTPGEGA